MAKKRPLTHAFVNNSEFLGRPAHWPTTFDPRNLRLLTRASATFDPRSKICKSLILFVILKEPTIFDPRCLAAKLLIFNEFLGLYTCP